VTATVIAFASSTFAQTADTSDYNQNLKKTLKQDPASPATPVKKVVHKKIKKVADKKVAVKGLPAKNTKVVAVTDSSLGTTSVKVKEIAPTEDAAPTTFESDSRGLGEQPPQQQRYGFQPQPYQPIFILQPAPAPIAQVAPAPVAQAPVTQTPAQLAATGPQSGAPAAQVQPTTNIDSTSVPEPKSDQLRRQREDMEHQTENKLIEKLEDDRIKSEKDRADRLFVGPQPSPSPTPAPAAPIAAIVPTSSPVPGAPPVASAVPGVVAVEVPAQTPGPVAPPAPETVKAEAIAVSVTPASSPAPMATPSDLALVGESTAKSDHNDDHKDEDKRKFSVGPMGGIPSYPTVNNINSLYTLGAMGNYKLEHRFSLQAAFDYSRFNINNTAFCPFCAGGTLVKGMDQYDISVGANYNILPYSITPVVGVLLDYARRNYYDVVDYGYTYGTPTGSNAFNAGLMVGADFKISDNLILGCQFSYLWNISYWTDNPLAYGLYGPIYGQSVESLNYYMATLNLRFLF
jgi:hypothetical protein